jgi:hypothetical protein
MLTAAASPSALLWPMLAQVGLTFALYAWLTVARLQAVRRREVEFACFVLGREEPPGIARITRNLANQFELPVVFYAVCVLLVALDRVIGFDIAAAWVFVLGRLVHTAVQTLTDDVPLRGRVFMINFLAVTALVGHVAVLAWQGGLR